MVCLKWLAYLFLLYMTRIDYHVIFFIPGYHEYMELITVAAATTDQDGRPAAQGSQINIAFENLV